MLRSKRRVQDRFTAACYGRAVSYEQKTTTMWKTHQIDRVQMYNLQFEKILGDS